MRPAGAGSVGSRTPMLSRAKAMGYRTPHRAHAALCPSLANIVAPVPIGKAAAPVLERANAIRPLGVDADGCRGMPTGVTAFARLPEHAATAAIAATLDVDDLGRIGAVLAAVRIGIARLAVLLVGVARACADRRSPASCRCAAWRPCAWPASSWRRQAAPPRLRQPPRAPSALPRARAPVPSVSVPALTAPRRRRSSHLQAAPVTSRRRAAIGAFAGGCCRRGGALRSHRAA